MYENIGAKAALLGVAWAVALAACHDAKTEVNAVTADAASAAASDASQTPSSTAALSTSPTGSPVASGHSLKCGWPGIDQTKTQVCDGATQYCLATNGVIMSYGCTDHAPCSGSSVVTCECLALPKPSGKTCVDSPSGATVTQGNG